MSKLEARLRVCFVCFAGYPDQGATYCYEMSRAVSALGHDVTVVAVQRDGEPAEAQEDGVRVLRLPSFMTVRWGSPRRWGAKAAFLRTAAAVVRREAFEVVHVYCTIGAGLLPWWGGRRRAWVLEHQTGAVSSRSRGARWLEDRLRAWQGLTFDANFTVTGHLGRRLFSNPAHFEVVPAGVNRALFAPGTSGSMRQELGIADTDVVFAHAGVLEAARATDVPLRAFALAFAGRRDAWLLMPGKGSQLPELRRLAATLGVADRVWLPGYVPYRDVPRVLAAADAGVSYLPAVDYYNGQPPMKVIEYLSAGLPVIASDVPSHRELVRPGVNGLLAAPDPEALAAVLRDFAADAEQRRRLAEAAVASIEHLTYDRIARERVLPAYHRLLARP